MEPRPRRRLRLLAGGLVLTFGGLFLASLLLPSDAQGLTRGVAIGAVGLASLWVGGILLGRASGGGRSSTEGRS